jgi:hypothetical protein
MAEQHETMGESPQDTPQCRGIHKPVTEPHKSGPCIDRRVVNKHNWSPLLHFWVIEHRLERIELFVTEVPGGDERRAWHRARERDNRHASPQLDAGEATRWQIPRERRKITPDEPVEMMREAPLAMCRGQVDVVIAWHDGHFGSPSDLVE